MTGQRFDWQAARERLSAMERSLRSGPEDPHRILEARARKLAEPLPEASAAADDLHVLIFSRSGERYAVEASHIVEALPPVSPTTLPGARRFLTGVIHHRGQIVAVFDLPQLLATSGAAGKSRGFVVVVEVRDLSFGLLADQVSGMSELAASTLVASSNRHSWIRGMTPDMVSILDLDGLAQDPRVSVNDE